VKVKVLIKWTKRRNSAHSRLGGRMLQERVTLGHPRTFCRRERESLMTQVMAVRLASSLTYSCYKYWLFILKAEILVFPVYFLFKIIYF